MKRFQQQSFDPENYRKQFKELTDWLDANPTLDEEKDILPFFKQHHHISVQIGQYISKMKYADLFAFEFPIHGDFVADLVVGDARSHHYLLV